VHKILLPLRMLILLDCRPLQNAGPESEKSRLIFAVVNALSGDPGVQWLLVAGSDHPVPEVPGATVITQRAWPYSLGWRVWYDAQLPRLAKKYRPDWVMTTGGVAIDTRIPQCIWMPERANPKEGQGYVPQYAERSTESLKQARAVFCYSDRDREWLAARAGQPAGKLVVVHPAPEPAIGPLSLTGRSAAKANFAKGRVYFLADAAAAGEEGVILLLKAFSLFKKRQQSNLQLVITGIAAAGLQTKLETYKYRDDVRWFPLSAGEDQRLKAGAYASLLLWPGQSLGAPVLEAWKAGVPVIVKTGGPFQEWGGDAVLAADGADPASLASQLMSIYKDEGLRGRLVDKGLTRVAAFTLERTVGAVRAAIGRMNDGQ